VSHEGGKEKNGWGRRINNGSPVWKSFFCLGLSVVNSFAIPSKKIGFHSADTKHWLFGLKSSEPSSHHTIPHHGITQITA
jgi:hypothetical protein